MTDLPDKIWVRRDRYNSQTRTGKDYSGTPASSAYSDEYARITEDTIILSRKELEGMKKSLGCGVGFEGKTMIERKAYNKAIDEILKLPERS